MELSAVAVDDIVKCAELFISVYSEPPYFEKWNLSDAQAYLTRFREIDPEGCFLTKDNNQIAGAIFSYSYPWHEGRVVCIQELFVVRNYRQKGIAKKLLSAIGKGKNTAAWLVAHERSEASAFYKHMGFTTDSPYKFRSGMLFTYRDRE